MANTPPDDERREAGDTGPQGTRVFRRADIEQYLRQREAESKALDETPSGALFMGLNGPLKDRKFPIPAGRSTLGRDAANDIIIDADSVSLVHARLVEKDGRWRVLNLLSTNGTWVNNRKVSDSLLQDGDTICFGEAEFTFHQPRSSRRGRLRGLLHRLLGLGG